jgi:hypothetical protein
VHDSSIYFASTNDNRITVLDQQGRTSRVITRTAPLERVTTSERSAYLDHQFPQLPNATAFRAEMDRSMIRAWKQYMVFPEFHRAFVDLRVDSENNIWVRLLPDVRSFVGNGPPFAGRPPDYVAPQRWDVLSPEGTYLATISLPRGFDIHDIGADYVLGVWCDADGVPFVRLYSLTKR